MKRILVPTDFTNVADNALAHGVELARMMKGEVVALHVVAKESDRTDAMKQLEAQTASYAGDITIANEVRVGHIFEDIGDTALELGANVVVMGTHGLRGLQYLRGSDALRVITGTHLPFIVVQGEHKPFSPKNIVMPIDIAGDTKAKLRPVVEIARVFSATVHLFVPRENDPEDAKRLEANLEFSKEYLASHLVQFHTLVAGTTDFHHVVVAYAEQTRADMIAIVNNSGERLLNLFGMGTEQHVITNKANIPVLIITPQAVHDL